MKKKTKYYDGPDGVFYDPKHDEIFFIQRSTCGSRWININTGKDLGALYIHEDARGKSKKTALLGMESQVRLGDL